MAYVELEKREAVYNSRAEEEDGRLLWRRESSVFTSVHELSSRDVPSCTPTISHHHLGFAATMHSRLADRTRLICRRKQVKRWIYPQRFYKHLVPGPYVFPFSRFISIFHHHTLERQQYQRWLYYICLNLFALVYYQQSVQHRSTSVFPSNMSGNVACARVRSQSSTFSPLETRDGDEQESSSSDSQHGSSSMFWTSCIRWALLLNTELTKPAERGPQRRATGQ